MAGSWNMRGTIGIGRALLALLLVVLASPADALVPQRLEEQCRIAADASTPVSDIAARLDRCDRPAPNGYVGTLWVGYDRMPTPLTLAKTWRLVLDNHRVSAVDLWLIGPQGPPQHYAYDPNAP